MRGALSTGCQQAGLRCFPEDGSPMPDLEVTTRRSGNAVVVEPRGFVNAHTVAEFESVLNGLVEAGDARIVISGVHLSYVASAGFGAIMGLIEEARARGGDIRVADLTGAVAHIFRVLGFDRLCRTFAKEEEAVGSFESD